jgi:L-threonylcarbamoyladenylate synthase
MTFSEINPGVIRILQNGGILVLPTDTIYGLVGSALHEATIERIYKIKERQADKPCIVLIADLDTLRSFEIEITPPLDNVFKRYWPGPTSLALAVNPDKYFSLHRGTNRIAFRLPSDEKLIACLKETGPLIATSVNPTGQPPATSIKEAQLYFQDQVDGYVDQGTITAAPSQLLLVKADGSTTVLRP